jgi:hypothetical protein
VDRRRGDRYGGFAASANDADECSFGLAVDDCAIQEEWLELLGGCGGTSIKISMPLSGMSMVSKLRLSGGGMR